MNCFYDIARIMPLLEFSIKKKMTESKKHLETSAYNYQKRSIKNFQNKRKHFYQKSIFKLALLKLLEHNNT